MINSLPKQPTIPPMSQRRTDQMSMIPIKIERREPIMRWIPCSERLPETAEDVLLTVCGKTFTVVVEGCHRADGKWWSFRQNGLIDFGDVIAWMPLPEHYKGVTK